MLTKDAAFEALGIRASSAKATVFNALADGKVHSLPTVRKAVIKHGNAGTGIGAIYGLGRIMQVAKFSHRLLIDREKDTVQFVPATRKPAKKSGATKKPATASK